MTTDRTIFPAFALSLSFEGIRLLVRQGDGWALVDEVAVDVADLDSALGALKAKAQRIHPGPLRCKLILPNDQIKYLTLGGTLDAGEVRAALVGATPYDVKDLRVDHVCVAGRTFVAAVALETLKEAEAFALNHGFGPVSFVAAPEPFTYDGEAFFGHSFGAKDLLDPGQEVARELTLAQATGVYEEPQEPEAAAQEAATDEPEATQPPQEAEAAEATPADVADDESQGTGADEAPLEAPEAAEAASEEVEAVEADNPAVISFEAEGDLSTAEDGGENASSRDDDDSAEVAASPEEMAPDGGDEDAVDPMVVVEPLKDGTDDGAAGSIPLEEALAEPSAEETAEEETAEAPASDDTSEDGAEDETPAEIAARDGAEDSAEAEAPEPAPDATFTADQLESSDQPEDSEPALTLVSDPDIPLKPSVSMGSLPPEPSFSFASRRGDEPPAPAAAASTLRPEPTFSHSRRTGGSERPQPRRAPAATPVHSAAKPAPQHSDPRPPARAQTKPVTSPDEAERMTVFGARPRKAERPAVGGRPKYLGVMLTAALLVFMVAVAAWAAVFTEDGLSRWFTRDTDAPQIEVATAPLVADESPALGIPQTASAPGDADVTRAVADAITQTVGFDEAPATDVSAQSSGPAPLSDPELSRGTDVILPSDPDQPLSEDNTLAAAPEPLSESPSGAEDGGDGPQVLVSGTAEPQGLSPAEAERIYAITGVWQKAPVAPRDPSSLDLGELVFAGADPAVNLQDTPTGLVTLAAFSSDGSFVAPADPPAAEAQFDLDENGRVRPTEDGALTPEGALVFSGQPPILPPERPDFADEIAAATEAAPTEGETLPSAEEPTLAAASTAPQSAPEDTTPEDPLAAFRPLARPDSVTAAAEQAAAEAAAEAEAEVTRAASALAGTRPLLRPDTLVPDALLEPTPTADAAAIAAAIAEAGAEAEATSPFVDPTARAVALSIRPDDRPRNFNRTVARAQEQAARAAEAQAQQASARQPENQAPATSRPSGQTTTTVAQAATQVDVMNLRSINLIGVYGQPSDRRALVRLANGRYVRVQTGDRLDGGRVAAIGDSALRYVKNGRNIVIEIPQG